MVCGKYGINIDAQMGHDTFEYLIAAGYCVEMYADPREFSKGTLDEKYYSEIWIPVKKK